MKYFFIVSFILFIGCNNSDNTENFTSNDTFFYQQWSINQNSNFYASNNINNNAHINIKDVLNNYTGKGVKIAIIDDGFDVNHPELKDQIIKTISVNYDGSVIDDNASHTNSSDYHGTAVTGIIASKENDIGIRGIAPNSQLILIKMPESSNDNGIIELFNQAILNGADIINCSWGTNSVSDVVRDYINEISNTSRNGKGVLVVFASGNDNSLMSNDESSIKNVISVGATNKDNLRTDYSNYGKELDIVAPGGETLGITTLDPINTNGETTDNYNRYNQNSFGFNVSFTGTSASAPIVTGALALALEKNPNLTRKELQDVLKYSTSIIGQNTPYLDDMIISSTNKPTISGILGSLSNNEIKINLVSKSSLSKFGPYEIIVNGNNTFSSTVTEELSEGNYTINIINSNATTVLATDENFEINTSKITNTNKTIKKSDFYGYGKLDLSKLLNNISSASNIFTP